MGYFYKAYELVFDSEIILPQFVTYNFSETTEQVQSADVVVRVGSVPPRIESPILERVFLQVASTEFLLNIPNIARYWVRDGSEIIIEPVEGVALETIRLFLLSTPLAMLLYQRDYLLFNGSVVTNGDYAVLFTGAPGTGKSTLALGMALNTGYKVMGDGVIAVCFDESGKPKILPAHAGLLIWYDMVELLQVDPKNLSQVRPELQKYFFLTHEFFHTVTIPLRYIISLVPYRDELTLEVKTGISKVRQLGIQLYQPNIIEDANMKERILPLLLRLFPNVDYYRLSYPVRPFQLDMLIKTIHEECQ